MRVIDCQCFAGGLTWSFVAEGFELTAKREHPAGFGVELVEANRALLGDRWQTEACDPSQWTPKNADVVVGNPPCSGFSCLNSSSSRGMDSPVNRCMFDFVRFAGKCRPAVIVMESVQQAYTGGRPLMLRLRQEAEEASGLRYDVLHALHSVAALGGSQIRRRYFLVMTRVPFGIDERKLTRCKTGYSFIEDLADAELSWDSIPDGHITTTLPRHVRTTKLAETVEWKPGEKMGRALDRLHERGGIAAIEAAGFQISSVISSIFDDVLGSAYALSRVRPDKLWPTVTGSGMSAVHPYRNRTLTYREAARLMGFPDDWTLAPCRENRRYGHAWFGKGVTTFAGRWIARLTAAALRNEPHPVTGDDIGERERYVNVSNMFMKPNLVAAEAEAEEDDDEGE